MRRLLFVFCLLAVAVTARQKPNIIFILADDIGWGDLAVNGHPHILTPNLDQMAAEGMRFQEFTVNNPVCSPSRVGLMTGNYPSRYGVHQHFASPALNRERGMSDWLDPEAVMLPKILKEAGYATAHYGKWHLCLAGARHGAPEYPAYGYDDAAVFAWPGPNTRGVFDGTPVEDKKGDPHSDPTAAYLTVGAVENALNFIEDHKDEPFFINLWIHESHTTIAARPEDRIHYQDVPEPRQTYYAAITLADTEIGRVLDKLDELGLTDDTIVIFTSDNGPEHPLYHGSCKGSAGGMRGHKRSLYNGGICTPFLIRWPAAVPAGKVDTGTMLSMVDMLPTLAAAAGVEQLPEGYESDGENMLAAWAGAPKKRSKPLYWKWSGEHNEDYWAAYAMRDEQWVFLMSEDRSRIELYDIGQDRAQENDLAAQHPERIERMRRATDQWIETLPKTLPARVAAEKKERSALTPYRWVPTPWEPKRDPKDAARAEMFHKLDTNSDYELSFEEYLGTRKDDAEGSLQKRYDSFDANKDGVLIEPEFVSAGQEN